MAIPAPKTVPASTVAAIAAAIYAVMGDRPYVIRDIRPMEPAASPLWQKAGLLEMMNRRSGLFDRRRY